MTLFRTRPRRAVVALFASAGILLGLGGAVGAADAHPEDGKCVSYSVWVYWSDQGREYKKGPRECLTPNTPFHTTFYLAPHHDGNTTPTGTPGGGGAEIGIPTP